MRQTPACMDVNPGKGEHPLLVDVAQQRSEIVTGNTSLCVTSDLQTAVMRDKNLEMVVSKCSP
jgi:hypothetical protein